MAGVCLFRVHRRIGHGVQQGLRFDAPTLDGLVGARCGQGLKLLQSFQQLPFLVAQQGGAFRAPAFIGVGAVFEVRDGQDAFSFGEGWSGAIFGCFLGLCRRGPRTWCSVELVHQRVLQGFRVLVSVVSDELVRPFKEVLSVGGAFQKPLAQELRAI